MNTGIAGDDHCGAVAPGVHWRNTSAERRLQQLGIALPAAPKPLGAYVPAVQVGNLLFLSERRYGAPARGRPVIAARDILLVL